MSASPVPILHPPFALLLMARICGCTGRGAESSRQQLRMLSVHGFVDTWDINVYVYRLNGGLVIN